MRYQGVIPHHVIAIAVGEEQPHSKMTWQLQKIASENDVVFLCDANQFLVSVLWRSDDGLTSIRQMQMVGFPGFPVLKPLIKIWVSRFVAGIRKERHVRCQPTMYQGQRGRGGRERYRIAISLADTIARRSAVC